MLHETLTGWNEVMREMDVRYLTHPTELLTPGELVPTRSLR